MHFHSAAHLQTSSSKTPHAHESQSTRAATTCRSSSMSLCKHLDFHQGAGHGRAPTTSPRSGGGADRKAGGNTTFQHRGPRDRGLGAETRRRPGIGSPCVTHQPVLSRPHLPGKARLLGPVLVLGWSSAGTVPGGLRLGRGTGGSERLPPGTRLSA